MPTAAAKVENAALVSLFLFVGALQVSIAASALLLTLTLGLWVTLLVMNQERFEVPAMFWPLLAYAAVTMIAVAASIDPIASLVDAKEVLLFLVVPVVYRLARGQKASTVTSIIITVGAATAVFGTVQYGILNYDHLGQRPQGSMGHYMTFSGLLMLVIGAATARLLFGDRDRVWAAMVLPALVVALTVTFTRSAWVGASVGIGLLFVLRDYRLLAVAPVLAVVFFTLAPASLTDRVTSMFDLRDPTNRDRVAMARAGLRMIQDHPMTGVGPDMVQEVYGDYRDAAAVNDNNPHLHNVPLHIAAERGLPAFAIWLWFVVTAVRELVSKLGQPDTRALAAAGLAALSSMLAAGMFEYNFGDSEFLMLLLVLLTLPAAAARTSPGRQAVARGTEPDSTPIQHGHALQP